jgi:hypothetical protein
MMCLRLTLFLLSFFTGSAFGQGLGTPVPNPYAGQQNRAIKALDAREVNMLRQGAGMGLAKAAELNAVPGPMHTLELANRLNLTTEQRAGARVLMDEHKARARLLGEEIVTAEAQLDQLFQTGAATQSSVVEMTAHIAQLQGPLRAEHLITHLKQAAVLTDIQRGQYARLRGYTNDEAVESEPLMR